MTLRQYKLRCQVCDTKFDDDGYMLECRAQHEPTLLITEYTNKQLECNQRAEGIYRYQNWLPVRRTLPGASRTVTYQSARLSRVIGLPHLWIAYNGYWPERGATLGTATFKELEAYTVLARIPEGRDDVLVVASAGNTAAAFARVCSQSKCPCLIIIPESGLQRLQFREPLDPCVKIVSLSGFVDYYDAITLAAHIS
ncbi:MAG TPA: hypothetical protein VJ761_22530, partial [Ktedonobacteraceae bacterium]|nr:hypothetical protein [Ktedonobacteraceae bacterium]